MGLVWEVVEKGIWRSKVPTGWLVKMNINYISGITFVPDPKFEWKPYVSEEDVKNTR